MWQNGCHTRFQHGNAWVMPLPAHRCHVHFFSFPDTRRIGSYQAKPSKHINSSCFSAEAADSGRNSQKKKKKKVQNALFELNNKTLNYLSSQNAPFFNL